jgi:oligopeptide transport system ATP-binding protein
MRTRIAMPDPTSSPASLLQATERQCMPELTAVPTDTSDVILSAEGLVKHFPIKEGIFFKHEVGSVKAVDGVSLTVRRGETLGLVGETGCGKSTLARSIMRLYPLTAGRLDFDGVDISTLSRSKMRPYRRGMQMIFQDPYGSLNPRRRVGSIIGDPLAIHKMAKGEERTRRVQGLMEVVGLNPEHYNRFPAEFSGGQRQRIGVARALALHPKLIVCDEPVSALDVSIQAQIINLLDDLQVEFGLTYLFIAHDLSVVQHVSNRVAVMYLGKLVEVAEVKDLYGSPRHPYTNALLSASVVADPDKARSRDRIILSGDVPSPINPPSGCRFHTRCPKAQAVCSTVEPPLQSATGDPASHQTACHFPVADGEKLASENAKILRAVEGFLSDEPPAPAVVREESVI